MVEYVGRSSLGSPRPLEGTRVAEYARRLDWLLLGATAALVGYGLWLISGITREDVPGNPDYFVYRQLFAAVLGTIALVGAIFVDPDLYRRAKKAIYGVIIALPIFVLVAGSTVNGAKRWIDLGFYQFQPSELGKVLLVLFLAAFLADRHKRIGEVRTIAAAVGLALVPTLLVFMQPDIGTALVFIAASAAVLFLAGARWTHLGVLLALGALVLATVLWFAPAAGVEILKPYQEARLTAFANPDEDPGGVGWNVNQSMTAVGAGGLSGRGVTGATQTKLNYLPFHETDFAFASLAEQRGFVGASVLLLLYLLLIWRAIRISTSARDLFSATVAGAIAFVFLFQIFVNVGMTMGIAPITGIPLPFVSVGGSSIAASLLAVGILQAIAVRHR
jgi:rod shape determining protein RodA